MNAVHARLRAATAECHDAVDRAFGRFDLTERESYTAFLTAHARIVPAIESALAGEPSLPEFAPRTPALLDDLARIGVMPPPAQVLEGPRNPAEALGMLYVLEGSRLGGAMLARSVPAGLPHTYLSSVHPPGAWRAFCADLDAAGSDGGEAWFDQVSAGAIRAFALYERAAG